MSDYNYLWVADDGEAGFGFDSDYPTALSDLESRVGYLAYSLVFRLSNFGYGWANMSFNVTDSMGNEYLVIVPEISPTAQNIADAIDSSTGYLLHASVVLKAEGGDYDYYVSFSSYPSSGQETAMSSNDNCSVACKWLPGKTVVALVKAGNYSIEKMYFYGGDYAENRPCQIIGYKGNFDTTNHVSDLDKGQVCHESPLRSYVEYKAAGGDLTACAVDYPKITNPSGNVFHLDFVENFHIKNLAITTTYQAVGRDTIANVAEGHQILEGCKFLGNSRALSRPACTGAQIIRDCFVAPGPADSIPIIFSYMSMGKGIEDSVVMCSGANQECVRIGSGGGFVRRNVFIGGSHGVNGIPVVVDNNTFIDQTVALLKTSTAEVHFRNNLCIGVEGGNTHIADMVNIAASTLLDFDHNWYYDMAGTLANSLSVTEAFRVGNCSSWNVSDPRVADVDGGDFRSLNKDVLEGGSVEIDGGTKAIGCLSKRDRVVCWRLANPGRMSVVR